jgi:hypothetical protein
MLPKPVVFNLNPEPHKILPVISSSTQQQSPTMLQSHNTGHIHMSKRIKTEKFQVISISNPPNLQVLDVSMQDPAKTSLSFCF